MRPPSSLTFSWMTLCLFAAGCQVSTAPAPIANGDLVAHLVALNDDAIPAQLARQQRDRTKPTFGGVRDDNGLYHAGAASGFIRNLTAAYVSPASRFAESPELLEALDDAATFMLSVQHADGTIDLLTTNFHSPPDTGFILEWMCSAASVLRSARIPAAAPLLTKLLTFIQRGADALAVGGIHTPNHRWVVCMALARANSLIPDSRYVDRIDTWLAENIDIDPDGQFTERSTSIYSPLTDRCLITIARLLDRPNLLEPVRRNLEMSLYYMHADGQIATEGSRRQDQYQRSSMLRYYYPYRYMAMLDDDGRFASVVRRLESDESARLSGQLIYFLESPELAGPLPETHDLPSDYERHFTHSKLVRIRRGDISATILEDNPSFFSLHVGGAAVVMRFASAFFGKGQFVGSQLHKEGSAWVMRQDLTGPYYQPIAKALRRADGNWHAMDRAARPTSEVQKLQSIVRISEQPGGFDVELEITGTDGVPIAIEFGCHADTRVQNSLGTTGKAVMSVGDDHIHLGNGQVPHDWTQIRGALPKLPGKSLYATGFTPFRRTLEFRNDEVPRGAGALAISESAASIVIRNGEDHVLTYHKAEMPPPAGSSPLYRRSGFIHPITAPNGGVVTGIHAVDHPHHMGLWHAWVRTTHKGRDVDFWNLKKGTATVRYTNTKAIRRSPDAVGFTVTQQHVILPDEVVLEEAFSIDVRLHPDGHYLVDHVTVQENVSDAALNLPAYRYGGGIAFRGPLHWNENNSAYLTSEGRGRENGHESRARWCAMSGETEHGVAALTILGHPKNHDAPQRQRIWPATQGNKGAIFFNFVPIQETGWALQPGKPSTMRYRVVVSDGAPDQGQVDEWFREYAGLLDVTPLE